MKTVIYLDVLLLVNFLIAYFLILAAGLLSGQRAHFRRLAAGAGTAALSALILFAPPLPYAAQLAYKITTAALIIAAAYGVRLRRKWLAATLWYAALNVLLAGFALLYIYQTASPLVHISNLAVYVRLSPLLLLTLSGACCFVVGLGMRLLAPVEGMPAATGLEVELAGTSLRLRAVLDTGCHLKDPMTCLPVLLISYPDARTRLPDTVDAYLSAWFAGRQPTEPPPGTRLRMIPCATAAGQTLLPAFAVENVSQITGRGLLAIGQAVIAFSGQPLGGNAYEALYGADLLPLRSRPCGTC